MNAATILLVGKFYSIFRLPYILLELIRRFPSFESYIGVNASIIENPAFETAIAKIQEAERQQLSPCLTPDESQSVQRFLREINEPITTSAASVTNEVDVTDFGKKKRKSRIEPSEDRCFANEKFGGETV